MGNSDHFKGLDLILTNRIWGKALCPYTDSMKMMMRTKVEEWSVDLSSCRGISFLHLFVLSICLK